MREIDFGKWKCFDWKFILLVTIIGSIAIFFLWIVSGAEVSYYFKTYESIDLKIPCYENNYSRCLDSTLCNITVLYPNSSVWIKDKPMTYNPDYFNYTVYETDIVGEYSVSTYCVGSDYGYSTFVFKVTPTGKELSSGDGLIYLISLFASILIFCFCFYGALKIPYKNQRNDENHIIGINDLKFVKIILWCFSYVIFLFIVGILRGITANYITDVKFYNFFGWAYWILLSFMWPLIVVSLLLMVVLFIQDKKIKKALERGFPYEE